MEEEGLRFGYTHRQHKRSHAQMDQEEASASSAWRHDPFADDHDHYDGFPQGMSADNQYHRWDLPYIDNHDHPSGLPDVDRQSPAYPPTRYHFDRHPTPSFESALRSQARPPIERASSSAGTVYPHTAGPHLPRVDDMASSATPRFTGDGFDYRRPAGPAREQEAAASVDLTGDDMEDDVAIDLSHNDDVVIDLTADGPGWGASREGQLARHAREQRRARGRELHEVHHHRGRRHAPRLPRGMDIIIDLDNGDEEWNVDAPPPIQEPSSPEIEFISSRTIPGGRRPPPPTHENGNGNDNASDGDEEVEFLRANALPAHEQRRRQVNEQMDNVLDLFGTLNGRFTHLRAQVERFHDQVHRTRTQFGNQHEPVASSRSASRGRAPHIRVGVGAYRAPVMDFEMVGFEIGPRVREAQPSPPTYTAPPKAPEGFTRSPEEGGDALVCPNCEEELCVGGDETKRQVWIVKGCGHVYCGECTANRSAKRTAKGKERPANTNPFKICVVDGCDKNVSHKKSMIQVFL